WYWKEERWLKTWNWSFRIEYGVGVLERERERERETDRQTEKRGLLSSSFLCVCVSNGRFEFGFLFQLKLFCFSLDSRWKTLQEGYPSPLHLALSERRKYREWRKCSVNKACTNWKFFNT
ncbi:unnamed protein product, partial [Prunus brigantina]